MYLSTYGLLSVEPADPPQLPAHAPRCEHESEGDGPQRAQQQTLAVLAQACAGDKDILEFGRQLEE
eukprot:2306972-Prymnesium_polylepis.1